MRKIDLKFRCSFGRNCVLWPNPNGMIRDNYEGVDELGGSSDIVRFVKLKFVSRKKISIILNFSTFGIDFCYLSKIVLTMDFMKIKNVCSENGTN